MPETLGFNPENEKSWRRANRIDTSEGLVSALGDKKYDYQEVKDFATKWGEARASEYGPEVEEVIEKLYSLNYYTEEEVEVYLEKLKEALESVSDPKILVDVLKYSSIVNKDADVIRHLVDSWESQEGGGAFNGGFPDGQNAAMYFRGGFTTDKEMAIRDALKNTKGATDEYIIDAFKSGEIGLGSSAGFHGDLGIFGAIYDKQFLHQVIIEEILAPDVDKMDIPRFALTAIDH